MAERPDKLPEWATVDEIDPVSGQSNVVEPPPERKESGWTRREIPPRQWFNWLARTVGGWIEWARDEIDTLISRVTTNEGDIAIIESDLSDATNLPTPNDLARRDAAGRMRAADPVDLQDVVTKAFVANPANSSLTQNGYYDLPGGLIVQWGIFGDGSQLGANGGTFTYDFPKPFPNQCFSVIATFNKGSIDGGTWGLYSDIVSASQFSVTYDPDADAGNDTTNDLQYSFAIAVGY